MSTLTLAPPSDAPMPVGRIVRAYLIEARHDILRALRMPVFIFPMLALPVLLYLFFGVLLVGPRHGGNPNIALYVFSGFAMFGLIGPGMFGFGIGFAVERQAGLFTLKRALPMPAGAALLAKLCTSMLFAMLVVGLLIPLAINLGHVPLGAAQITRFVIVSMLGVVPFCAIGLLIGSYVSGTAAPGVVNLFYFPMIYLSGLFPFPLPKALQTAAVIWPVFHLNQLALSALGLKTSLDPRIAATVLLAVTAICLVLAIRRLARVG